MKNATKIILLSILLILPVAVFLFLKFFGVNQYELKLIDPKKESQKLQIYNPKAVNCESNKVDNVHQIPHFELTTQENKPFSQKNLNNKIYVADFFFTRCPTICLDMTSELLRVQDKFKDNPKVKIVSHSVDPKYDQPEVLAKYAKDFGIDTKKWTMLTGSKENIYELARCGYFIAVKPNEQDSTDFIHSDKLILVDQKKRIRGYYSGTDRKDVDRLITEIQLLLKES